MKCWALNNLSSTCNETNQKQSDYDFILLSRNKQIKFLKSINIYIIIKFSTLELKHRKKDCIGNFQFIPFSLLLRFFKSNRNDPLGVTFITCF